MVAGYEKPLKLNVALEIINDLCAHVPSAYISPRVGIWNLKKIITSKNNIIFYPALTFNKICTFLYKKQAEICYIFFTLMLVLSLQG